MKKILLSIVALMMISITSSAQMLETKMVPASASGNYGETVKLKAYIRNRVNTYYDDSVITWSTSDAEVATVDEAGLVTFQSKTGTATITAQVDEAQVTCTVTNNSILVSEITIPTPSATTGKDGETITLSTSILPTNATNQTVTWKSSDNDVATVDENGLVTFHAKTGEVTITATANDGSDKYAECTVTCNATSVESVSITAPENTSGKDGETIQMSANISPTTATNKAVTWKSSDDDVATVDNEGLVTFHAKTGDETITVTTKDGEKTATCTVTCNVTPVESVTIPTPEKTSGKDGETIQLSKQITPSNATNQTVTWTSSDETIATVSETGLVTFHAALGDVTITATAKDGSSKSATCTLTCVATAVESVCLDKTTASGKDGDKVTLTATVSPATATNKAVTWKSSDDDVATVDNEGLVTFHAKTGDATITATTTDGNKTATCTVTCQAIPVTGVSLDKTTSSGKDGNQVALTATVTPLTATNKAVTWISNDNEVATVDNNGLVTFHAKVGTTTIIVKTVDGEKTATCTVTCNATPATSIALDKSAEDVYLGKTLQLTATVLPNNTTNKVVTWTSSDPSFATVDENGLVTVVNISNTPITITATTTDGTQLSATCAITTKPVLAEEITLNKATTELTIGEEETLTFTIAPENATYKSVKWESDKPEIASVDDDGNVTAIKDGTAEITVTTMDGSGKSATCTVTVKPIYATGITLNQKTAVLGVAKTVQLSATVTPSNTTYPSVTWESDDENVATVSDAGLVTTVAPGTATITATTTDGSNLLATCEVTVKDKVTIVNSSDVQEEIILNEDDDFVLDDTYRGLTIENDIDVNSIKYSRTYKNTNWQPWYVPFGMTLDEDLMNRFSFGKFAGTYIDDDVFYITLVYLKKGDIMNPNVPYFIKAKTANSSDAQTITVDDATLKATQSNHLRIQSAEKNVDITGIYARKTATTDDCDWYYYSSGSYVHAKSGINLGAFRFYLEMSDREDNLYATPSPNPAKIEIMELNNDDTDIDEIHCWGAGAENDAMYNINGMRVDENYKGIVIKNGKKYLIK